MFFRKCWDFPCFFSFFFLALFLGICIIFFRMCWDFLRSFLFYFYFSVPYFGLACDDGNSFLCLKE